MVIYQYCFAFYLLVVWFQHCPAAIENKIKRPAMAFRFMIISYFETICLLIAVKNVLWAKDLLCCCFNYMS